MIGCNAGNDEAKTDDCSDPALDIVCSFALAPNVLAGGNRKATDKFSHESVIQEQEQQDANHAKVGKSKNATKDQTSDVDAGQCLFAHRSSPV